MYLLSKAVIGIKIADGSFYPILEEGKPGEKKLQVTTVRDDQTTVQINLYRSETGDMSDADYVDTLLIDNLVPHQKEEPSFNLLVKIDENNMLSAEIDDPETGEKSDTKVSLINMENKSIFDEPDYKVTPNDVPGDEEFSLADSMADIPDLDDTVIDAGTDDFSLPDFDSLSEPQEPATETPVASDDFSIDATTEEAPVVSDDFSFDTTIDDAPAANDDFGTFSTPAEEVPAATASDDFSFDLPDDPSVTTDTSEPVAENAELSEPVPEAVLSDDDFSFSNDFVDDENDIDEDEKPFSFDSLPEFDEIPELANSVENTESAMDDDLDIDFTVPEDNNMETNSYNGNTEYEYAPSNNMQNALFGDSDLFEETKKQ